MEKNALLAVIISLLILILYQEWVARRYGVPPPPKPKEEMSEGVEAPPRHQPQLPEAKIVPRPPVQWDVREVRVETDDYVAVFTNRGARLKSFTLKHYRTSVDQKSPPLEMISAAPGVPHPLGIQIPGLAVTDDRDLIYTVQGGNLRLTGDARGTLFFQTETPGGFTLTKKFTFTGSGYTIHLETSAGGAPAGASPALVLTSDGKHKGAAQEAVFEGFLALIDNKIRREARGELQERKEFSGPVSWAGFGYTYFLFAVLPENGADERVAVKESEPALLMEINSQADSKAGGSSRYTLFIGPKDLDVLQGMQRGLEQSIDFGWFRVVSLPILYALRFSHRFTASYGIDIILLTTLIKILTAPLTYKSFVSMKQMQKLQPQMERIKEKYKNDREKLNKEIMELYRRNKVNPFGGCLPMVLQIPVFIGLYNALLTPIELRHAPFMWIKDLSRPDWESLPVTLGGWQLGIPILTLLMGASMFVQQWMMPAVGDPNQRKLMMLMPLIFTVMFVTFPSGLVLYWLINNVLSIGQQYMINRSQR